MKNENQNEINHEQKIINLVDNIKLKGGKE